jgi:hypothetical protein
MVGKGIHGLYVWQQAGYWAVWDEENLAHPSQLLSHNLDVQATWCPNHSFKTIPTQLIHPMHDLGWLGRVFMGSMSGIRSVWVVCWATIYLDVQATWCPNHSFKTVPIHLIHSIHDLGWLGRDPWVLYLARSLNVFLLPIYNPITCHLLR